MLRSPTRGLIPTACDDLDDTGRGEIVEYSPHAGWVQKGPPGYPGAADWVPIERRKPRPWEVAAGR